MIMIMIKINKKMNQNKIKGTKLYYVREDSVFDDMREDQMEQAQEFDEEI